MTGSSLASPLAALPIAAVLACAEGDGGARTATVTDSAGITIVTSARPEWTAEEAWRLSDTPAVSIGVVDGAAPQILDGVVDALRMRDGGVLILDGGSRELRFFDASGAHVRTLGGAGGGPGEFRELGGAVFRGDSLWVFDPVLGRITIFGPDGAVGRTVRFEPTRDVVRPIRLYRLGSLAGDSALLMRPWMYPANLRPREMVYWDSVPTLLYSTRGELLGSVGPPGGMQIHATPRVARSLQFGRVAAIAYGDGRLYHSDADDFEIGVYDLQGELRGLIRIDSVPPAVASEAWQELTDRMLREVPESQRKQAVDWRDRAALAERRPAHGPQMMIAPSGHLWLEAFVHRLEQAIPGWLVFSPDGRWLGSVSPSQDLRIHTIRGDALLASWRDDLGVERVGVWPILRSAATPGSE